MRPEHPNIVDEAPIRNEYRTLHLKLYDLGTRSQPNDRTSKLLGWLSLKQALHLPSEIVRNNMNLLSFSRAPKSTLFAGSAASWTENAL